MVGSESMERRNIDENPEQDQSSVNHDCSL
jgi:hypothetical protein